MSHQERDSHTSTVDPILEQAAAFRALGYVCETGALLHTLLAAVNVHYLHEQAKISELARNNHYFWLTALVASGVVATYKLGTDRFSEDLEKLRATQAEHAETTQDLEAAVATLKYDELWHAFYYVICSAVIYIISNHYEHAITNSDLELFYFVIWLIAAGTFCYTEGKVLAATYKTRKSRARQRKDA